MSRTAKSVKSKLNVVQETRGIKTVYKVKSLVNRITPEIGRVISAADVEKFIEEGVEVSIKK